MVYFLNCYSYSEFPYYNEKDLLKTHISKTKQSKSAVTNLLDAIHELITGVQKVQPVSNSCWVYFPPHNWKRDEQ